MNTQPVVDSDKQALNAKLKACMARVAQVGDTVAFEQLFDHFAPRIKAFSLAREPGAAVLADELAQDVMIKVWDKAHTYKPELAQVSTWIFTLARNSRIDQLRRNGRFNSDIDPEDIFIQLEDESHGPFQSAYLKQLETGIDKHIDALPFEQARVLRKVYLEGRSHSEAAIELSLPLGTVKSRVRLALQKLALLLRSL